MSRNSENHLQSSRVTTGPFLPSGKMPLVPVLVVCAGVLVALFAWTLPNWTLFSQNAPRFSALWHIAAARQVIIILGIKVFSPVLVGLLLAACNWLWYLVEPFLKEEEMPKHPPSSQMQDQRAPQLSAMTAAFSVITATPQHVTPQQRGGKGLQINPETPLPPTLDQPLPNPGQAFWSNAPSPYRGELLAHTPAREQRQVQGEPGMESPFTSPEPHARATADERGELEEHGRVANISKVNAHLGKQRPYEVSLTLLKKVSMTLITAQGISREVPLSLNAKRVQLLAYLAWLRGQTVHRDRLLEQVFGHGKDDEEATREKLGEAFDSHKKLIRWDLREALSQLNRDAGTELIPPDLDIFAHKQRLYWLAEVCHVVDLEEIEKHHKVIELARKDGLLVDQVPDYVKGACDQLMAAYSGDFLAELITDYLDDFEPWVSSWARKPYTLFRDYYLQALWYAAEYELHQGQQYSDERLDIDGEANRKEQRKHWSLAAQNYLAYAMNACISRFDTKVTFGNGAGREHGERVIMSERALRRSLVLYGSIGETHHVDQFYVAYYKQMRSISAKVWEPSKATLADLRSAKEQTNAYRFPTQVTPHEPLPPLSNHLETSA